MRTIVGKMKNKKTSIVHFSEIRKIETDLEDELVEVPLCWNIYNSNKRTEKTYNDFYADKKELRIYCPDCQGSFSHYGKNPPGRCMYCASLAIYIYKDKKDFRVNDIQLKKEGSVGNKWVMKLGEEFPVIIQTQNDPVCLETTTIILDKCGIQLNETGSSRPIKKNEIDQLKSKSNQYFSYNQIREIFGIIFQEYLWENYLLTLGACKMWWNIRAFKKL